MEIGRVLIVSPHSLFAEALARLVQQAGGTVIARVSSVEEALAQLDAPTSVVETPAEHSPELQGAVTIIVEHTEGQGEEPAWLKLLETHSALRRVVLLTLQGNEMIVHEQRRVNHVSEQELLGVLQGTAERTLNPDEYRVVP
ncbi:MAG: hypothetical protein HY741_30075 [Chloroflexi bacterium]|nr:hypothetical protein [Chloroflexota bacterium]